MTKQEKNNKNIGFVIGVLETILTLGLLIPKDKVAIELAINKLNEIEII